MVLAGEVWAEEDFPVAAEEDFPVVDVPAVRVGQAVLASNVLTEIKMGGSANLRVNFWVGCLIDLIPTRMVLLIRLKSMPCVKTSPKAVGARVEAVFKEAKHVPEELVEDNDLAVKAEDKHVPEDLGGDRGLEVKVEEKLRRV